MRNRGFIFIETIIVICILTIALMSLYNNYSKIITNTRELNTFDTAEYNYKTYFLKETYDEKKWEPYSATNPITGTSYTVSSSFFPLNHCLELNIRIAEFNYNDIKDEINKPKITDAKKVCVLENVSEHLDELVEEYSNIDAYIIDYLRNQDLNETNDNLFLVEYKKLDKQNDYENNEDDEYLTYISSLTY